MTLEKAMESLWINWSIKKKDLNPFDTIQRNSENSGLSLDNAVDSCHWYFSFSTLIHVFFNFIVDLNGLHYDNYITMLRKQKLPILQPHFNFNCSSKCFHRYSTTSFMFLWNTKLLVYLLLTTKASPSFIDEWQSRQGKQYDIVSDLCIQVDPSRLCLSLNHFQYCRHVTHDDI